MPKIIGGAVVTAVAAASVAGAAISSAKAGRAATKGNIDAANTKDARSMAAEEEGEVCCCCADAGRELDSWHLQARRVHLGARAIPMLGEDIFTFKVVCMLF